MIQHWLNKKSRDEALHCHLACIQTGIHTTLVWDNNDFGEETLSGKGTTHNTNGIAVQHAQCQLHVTVAQAPSTVEAKKKTKQRSLVAPDEDIIMFVGEKKSSPEAFSADIELELGPHLKTMQHHKDKDTAYYLTKSAPDNLLPSWTGFNQLLKKKYHKKRQWVIFLSWMQVPQNSTQ